MRHNALAAVAAFLAIVLLSLLPASAAEVIRSYDQSITVNRANRLDVVDEITVVAEGNRIRRGIYRDFPTAFVDADGRTHQVGFTVESVTRDGAEEPYSTSRSANGVRVLIGDENVFLAPGPYTYRIAYSTTRQLRSFEDHDELYWNVTGSEWAFPILKATATVTLPEGVTATSVDGYTGGYGAVGKNFAVDGGIGDRRLVFRTTRTLQPGEGLTIAVGMPSGTIAEPTSSERLTNLFLDYGSSLIAFVGLAVVLVYYVAAWLRVGRDPPKGTVIPLFEAPDGVSAPLAQYVHERGLSGGGWTAMSAAWISLAVRGLVDLSRGTDEKNLKILRTKTPAPAKLPAGEKALLDWLDKRGGYVLIARAIGREVQKLNGDFRAAVYKESRQVFFEKNRGLAILGIALSVGALVLAAVVGTTGPEDLASVFPLFFAIAFSIVGATGLKGFRRADGASGVIGGLVLMIVGFGLMLVTAAASIGIAVGNGSSYAFPLVALALAGVNVLFFYLLEAPTVPGRALMDKIEGLLLYMTVAEKQRLNMPNMPPVTPSRFETLLPYAVALGVEKPWTAALEAQLLAAGAVAAAAYQPAWFHGTGTFDARRDLAGTISSMSRTFQTSVPPPKSSSSGSSGGGFSGGGGGGGGGGGW